MPNPEDWGKFPNREEFLIPIYYKDVELRIRVKIVKKESKKRAKKKINFFSVGLEAQVSDQWKVLVRHCSYHEKTADTFHTHNPYVLDCVGATKKFQRKLPKKKTPDSQFRWAVKNMKHFSAFYYKDFIKLYKPK